MRSENKRFFIQQHCEPNYDLDKKTIGFKNQYNNHDGLQKKCRGPDIHSTIPIDFPQFQIIAIGLMLLTTKNVEKRLAELS